MIAGPGPGVDGDAPPTLPEIAETVVVGGGIVGLCCALYLARAGREVVLLERAAPWSDASGMNAGTLSLQVKTPRVWDLTRLALQLWERLGRELDGHLGFTRCGGLRVALDDAERARLRHAVRAQREHGLDVEYFDGAGLRARAPWLGPDVTAAAHCPDDAYASPLTAGPLIIDAAADAGALVAGACPVTDLARDGDGFQVHTGQATVRCAKLVLAAGAATGALAARLGVPLPVSADLNMLHITERAPPVMEGILTHVGGMLSLKQYPNGTCMIGGGWQGQACSGDEAGDVEHENLHHNLSIAARAVPALRGLRLVRSWTGLEALVPDALPLAGRVTGCEGLFVAACARGGYTLGPAQALLVCRQMLGRDLDLDVRAFSPDRWRV